MRHKLSNFVAVLCLLAFFVSSAACFAVPLRRPTNEIHMHRLEAAGHACCPNHSPGHAQVSNSCCTVHHQPTSPASAAESQLLATPNLIAFVVPLGGSANLHNRASFPLFPLHQPPLIALRI
jgi:hypothetical protein